jgi:hypothetical protein
MEDDQLRMLTWEECSAADRATLSVSEYAIAIQRKFCEVNGLTPARPTALPADSDYSSFLTELRDASRYLLQNGQTKQGLAVQACITMLEDDSEEAPPVPSTDCATAGACGVAAA